MRQHTHTHSRLTALCPGLPGWASTRTSTRKVKPIWILLKQETASGSGISWAICKSAPRSRQITTPAPHHSDFYRPDAFPAAQPTASKHWRDKYSTYQMSNNRQESTGHLICHPGFSANWALFSTTSTIDVNMFTVTLQHFNNRVTIIRTLQQQEKRQQQYITQFTTSHHCDDGQ